MTVLLGKLAVVTSPYLLGLLIGFAVAVFGLQRWFLVSSSAHTGDLVGMLRRVGTQFLIGGLLLTLTAGYQLGVYLDGQPSWSIIQHALWGLPVGLFFGARWMLRRGER